MHQRLISILEAFGILYCSNFTAILQPSVHQFPLFILQLYNCKEQKVTNGVWHLIWAVHQPEDVHLWVRILVIYQQGVQVRYWGHSAVSVGHAVQVPINSVFISDSITLEIYVAFYTQTCFWTVTFTRLFSAVNMQPNGMKSPQTQSSLLGCLKTSFIFILLSSKYHNTSKYLTTTKCISSQMPQ